MLSLVLRNSLVQIAITIAVFGSSVLLIQNLEKADYGKLAYFISVMQQIQFVALCTVGIFIVRAWERREHYGGGAFLIWACALYIVCWSTVLTIPAYLALDAATHGATFLCCSLTALAWSVNRFQVKLGHITGRHKTAIIGDAFFKFCWVIAIAYVALGVKTFSEAAKILTLTSMFSACTMIAVHYWMGNHKAVEPQRRVGASLISVWKEILLDSLPILTAACGVAITHINLRALAGELGGPEELAEYSAMFQLGFSPFVLLATAATQILQRNVMRSNVIEERMASYSHIIFTATVFFIVTLFFTAPYRDLLQLIVTESYRMDYLGAFIAAGLLSAAHQIYLMIWTKYRLLWQSAAVIFTAAGFTYVATSNLFIPMLFRPELALLAYFSIVVVGDVIIFGRQNLNVRREA